MADNEYDGFMKRAKDIINLLVVAALSWVGVAVQQSTTQIAVLSEQIRHLEDGVKEAKGSAADRYSASSASSDFRSRDSQISQNTNRLDALDSRVRNLEMQTVRGRK